MRLDKFLKVSRILKRRTVAQQACEAGKISVNGKVAKSSCQLKVGDKVTVHFASGGISFIVKMLRETTIKSLAEQMYEIVLEDNNA